MTRKSREPEPGNIRKKRAELADKRRQSPKNRLLEQIADNIAGVGASIDALAGEVARIGDILDERFPAVLVPEVQFGTQTEELPS